MDEGDHHAPLIEGGICIEDDDGVELITRGVVRRRGKGIAPPRGGLPV